MARSARLPFYSAAILERANNQVLIVRPQSELPNAGLWRFPGGPARPGESAEAAVRRLMREQLDVEVEIVVGQPPLTAEVDGQAVEMRFFFCGVSDEEPRIGTYADLRWVAKAQLREYDFDGPSKPVADWLVGE